MNPITILLLFCCLIGFVDKIRNNRWGLSIWIDQGLSAASSFVVPYIGVCCIGPLLIGQLSALASSHTLYDPAILLGSLLAPDLGGFKLSQDIASNPSIGAFSGVVIAGCFGQFISFQLPMLSATITQSSDILIKGFVVGLMTAPIGMIVGGLFLGLSAMELLRCSMPMLICVLISAGFSLHPELTQAILQRLGLFLQRICVVFFGITAVLLFSQHQQIITLLADSMISYVRMMVVIIGGCVFSAILTRFTKMKTLQTALHVNEVSIIGLLLSCINSIAITPLWEKMDDRGKKMNAAFAVSGAYLFGGQLAIISETENNYLICAFLISKLVSGILSIAALQCARRFENNGG